MLVQIIVSGLIFGCVYGLAALGMVLIFKTTDVVNFAQGEMAMVTAFVSYVFLSQMNLSYIFSFTLSLIFAAILGIVLYLVFMKRVQHAPPLNQMVVTLGLFLVLNGVAGLIWGHHSASYPEAFQGEPIRIGGVFISPNEIFIVILTIILMLIFFFIFKYTKIGLMMRATGQDMFASYLMGIKVSKIFKFIWGVGAVLGGIAGMLTAPITFLSPNMMVDVLVMAFAAAVLGGFVSLPGAFIGGLIIGVFENLISYYISPEMKLVYTFLLIVVILYVRPQGIFGGTKLVKKV
ncbi:branched-chain amino acid ABC transporter permease [Calidifontibacillus erzurumensis]|uniref:Branched-chain amino acid ABC transporter permease n=1 Tax=Calidifontibacillus erzurumensis TaxID=2741433 RepID=A0A8J8KAC7_9BACI|nr:branched-chain amino acid ABC transporter permease [Calidifontibacillus erzurumensis]NSL50512.1 branched-chain amino acid ABC transporter permease [Calidifontibacillus erzurumensis]